MKLVNNKRYTVLLVLGLVNITIGLAEMLKIIPYPGTATPGVSMMGSGIFILIIGLYLSRSPELESIPDERTMKRDMKVQSSTFGVILAYVTLLALVDASWSSNLINMGDFFLIFSRPEDMSVLFPRYMSIIFVAIISVVALTFYYNKKGDL
ncbi:MAG TPA: hypothetical protein C5S50_03380 [Methanosarcinaceae archaeon]|nr:hypothetical protein [Methanosarcinaceae archaeon]